MLAIAHMVSSPGGMDSRGPFLRTADPSLVGESSIAPNSTLGVAAASLAADVTRRIFRFVSDAVGPETRSHKCCPGYPWCMRESGSKRSRPTSTPMDVRAQPPPDWQDEMISRIRRLIKEADPTAIEEQKWKKPSNPAGVPVWYHDGILCHVGALKNRVRLTFLKGATLHDPKGLFNACLDGNAMRAIDIRAGDDIDAAGIKSLVRAAVIQNSSSARDRR